MIARRIGSFLAQPWVIAWVVAAVAPLVYYAVRMQASALGYEMFPMWVSLPDTFDLLWIVAPGAALGAAFLAFTLGPYRKGTLVSRLGAGVVLGGVLGWANVPLSVLLALNLYSARPDAIRGFSELTAVWLQSIPAMLALAFPVAVPVGCVLGFLVAIMGALEVPSEE